MTNNIYQISDVVSQTKIGSTGNFLEPKFPYSYTFHELQSTRKQVKELVTVNTIDLVLTIKYLKQNIGYLYEVLSCISAVDLVNSDSKYRFSVIYDLLSTKYDLRKSVKVFLNTTSKIESIVSVHPSASWYEREIWDLFGIFFTNHSDLRRILTDYGFEGHPLRKSFPLTGFIEAKYDINKKQVVMSEISLTQEMRDYRYSTKWE